MPPRRKTKVTIVALEGAAGAGIFGDINKWLKKTKVVSKVAGALGAAGVSHAGKVSSVAGSLGYGRGGALRVAGQGRKKAAPKKRAAPRR